MRDPLARAQRSALMAKVRGKGNKSTEQVVQTALTRARIRGWTKHPRSVPGQPDFYFPRYRLAVFVDGCFWHACATCARRTPRTRVSFWRRKISENRRRDQRVRKKMRAQGFRTIRIWEHELRAELWLRRLRATIRRIRTEKCV